MFLKLRLRPSVFRRHAVTSFKMASGRFGWSCCVYLCGQPASCSTLKFLVSCEASVYGLSLIQGLQVFHDSIGNYLDRCFSGTKMLIKEYRIPLPMSVEEYRIAQLYMIQVTLSSIWCIAFLSGFFAIWHSVTLAASSFRNVQSQMTVYSCHK